MAITATEIVQRLSGGATNTVANDALGGAMSTVGGGIITTASDNNLFDDVSGAEASAGTTEYRGFYIENTHGTLTWQGVFVWVDGDTTSADDELDIALADEAVNVAMEVIADETTAPAGPAFTHPTTKGTGLSIGDIPPGEFKGIWVRRVVTGGAAAIEGNSGSIRFEGDTAA